MKAIRDAYIKISRAFLLYGTAFITMSLPSCDGDNGEIIFQNEELNNIALFIEDNQENYSRFYELMIQGELKNALSAYNPHGNGFTLFLPTDEAFDRFIEKTDAYSSFEALTEDLDFVRLLTRYHVLNTSIRSNDFPYGALPDTTASGDLLTIGFSADFDSTVYKVNNIAPIQIADIEMMNGYIHVISEVLEPVRFTGYDWLVNNPGYSIISEAFKITGLKDTMGLYRISSANSIIDNQYTLLIEHDSIYAGKGIFDIEDLIDAYGSPGLDYQDRENGLYQFAAYHILEGDYFLDEFSGSQNYNTYAIYPVMISSGIDIRINPGADTFDIEISGTDTSIINYIGMYYQESNVLTKNGPIHMITDVMELYKPSRSERTFQFLEEPDISEASKEAKRHEFIDSDEFEVLHWSGAEALVYVKSSTSNNANNNDYIELNGDFLVEYMMPKILPGRYNLEIRVDALSSQNATIQVYMDGKRLGSNIDLSTGGNNENPYVVFTVGTIEFNVYAEHEIKIRTLIPGRLVWDFVRFVPIK